LRNNCALVLVSAMSDYVSIVYRACKEKNCRELHSDFPNYRLTVVTVMCLLIALGFLSGKLTTRHVVVGVEL
jgi:hypothetical protein